jgi:hypothetical protein
MILILSNTTTSYLWISRIILYRAAIDIFHSCYLILCELSWLGDPRYQRRLHLFLRQSPFRFLVESPHLMTLVRLHYYCVDTWLVSSAQVSERDSWLGGFKVVLDVTVVSGFKTLGIGTWCNPSFQFCFSSLGYWITMFNIWLYVLIFVNSWCQIIGCFLRRFLLLVYLLYWSQVWHFNEVRLPYSYCILVKLDVSSKHLKVVIKCFEYLLHSFGVRDVLHDTLVWTLHRVQWNVEAQLVIGDFHEVMRVLYYHALAEYDHAVPVELRRFLSLSEIESFILHIIDGSSCTLGFTYKVSGVISWLLFSFL